MLVMFFEVFANAIIYKTFSTRLKGKINEMKKHHKAVDETAKAKLRGGGSGGNGVVKNLANGGGDAKAEEGRHGEVGTDEGLKRMVVKSEVAHVRDSTRFVSGSSTKKPDDREEANPSIAW